MTRLASLAVISVVGFVAVNAAYQKSNATYAVDMECANCIRSGNNYCLWIGGTGNGTIQTWNCTQDDKTWDITSAGGVPGGYMCSKGSDDQMNAIVNGCRPWLNQNHNDYCGPYIVDLTDSNSFSVGRSVQEMPVNSSCTYRAMSNCGYPEANFRVHNSTYHSDFDVAWASKDGVNSDNDLDGWQRNLTTDWNGSNHSSFKKEYYELSEVSILGKNAVPISDAQWKSCNGTYRNLWVTITRTQDSTPKAAANGLAENARQLDGTYGGPYYPGGALYPVFEVSFRNVKGSGIISTAFSFVIALAMVLALAF